MAACRMSTEISRRIRPGTSGAECGENGTWRSSASQSLADQTSHCQGWGRGFESLRPLQSACPQTFSADFRATKKATFRAVLGVGLGVLHPERYGESLSERLALSEAWESSDLLYKLF